MFADFTTFLSSPAVSLVLTGVDNALSITKVILNNLRDFIFDLLCYFSYVFLRGNSPGRPFSVRAVIVKPRDNVNVYVWDNLVCSYSVVLPYIEAISLTADIIALAIVGTKEYNLPTSAGGIWSNVS